MAEWETKALGRDYNYLAPDNSEIRLLAQAAGGGLSHCTLPAGCTSLPVHHRTVDEIWYFVSGVGEVWRQRGETEEVVVVGPSLSLTIPVGVAFQFRNTGAEPLCFVIVTMPPWPGAEEAVSVSQGRWPTP